MPLAPRRLVFSREKRTRSRSRSRSGKRMKKPQSATIRRTTMRNGLTAGASSMKALKEWGFPLTGAPMKSRAFNNFSTTGLSTRTLTEIFEPLDINRDATNINYRSTDVINVNGIKLDCQFRNLQGNLPLGVNIALVSPKHATTWSGTDFFLNPGGGACSSNFDNNRTYNEFQTLPINYDEYTVFSHDRFLLSPSTEAAVLIDNKNNSYKHYTKFVPIRRQVRYESSLGTPHPHLFLLVWCDRLLAVTGAIPVADTLTYDARGVIYWKDVI